MTIYLHCESPLLSPFPYLRLTYSTSTVCHYHLIYNFSATNASPSWIVLIVTKESFIDHHTTATMTLHLILLYWFLLFLKKNLIRFDCWLPSGFRTSVPHKKQLRQLLFLLGLHRLRWLRVSQPVQGVSFAQRTRKMRPYQCEECVSSVRF